MSGNDPIRTIAVAMTMAVVLFACGQLLSRRDGKGEPARFLALFLGLYGVVKADELLLLTGAYLAAPHLGALIYPVRMLLAPAFYAYVRAMTAPSPEDAGFKRADWGAALGPLAFFGLMSWFFVLPAEAKVGLVSLDYPDPALRDRAFLTCQLVFAVFLTVSVVYVSAALRLLARHGRSLRRVFSNVEDRSLAWLRTASLVLLAAWAWYTVGEASAVLGFRPAWYDGATAWLELALIGGIAFAGATDRRRKSWDGVDPSEDAAPALATPSYAKAALSQERMVRIARRLDAAITAESLYADPTLSLRLLSERVGVPQAQVSQTLSRQLGTSFFDYVNKRRVEEARRRLTETEDSVVEIAFGVGFNARSTFNAAFKKHTGRTPSAYRRDAFRPLTAAAQPAE